MKRRGRNDVRKILKKLLTAAEAIARLFGLKLFLILLWGCQSRGGVIVVDDYGHTSFDGCTRAVREFIRKREPGLFYETPMGGAFIIKQET